MDAIRFDALARSLDRLAPRRVALGALGAGFGALLAWVGINDAAAKKKHKKKKKCKPCQIKKKGKCKGPKPDGTPCGGANICQDGQCVPPAPTCDPACVAPEECVNGTCACPNARACADGSCCSVAPECNEDGLCFCEAPSICTCPPGEYLCETDLFQQCCLADDTCDPVDLCVTDTCVAGNDFCELEWAYCDSSVPCGCFTTADGDQVCADLSTFECPETSECTGDVDCDPGESCVDVSCCSDGGGILGACLPLCPPARAGARAANVGRSGAERKKALASRRR